MSTARKQVVANIILSQMGGENRLKAMIGAKHFCSDDDGNTLRFQFPNRLRSKPNYIKISLTGMDDYNIEFSRIGRETYRYGTVKVIKTLTGIYCDQLIEIFEMETGLTLTLFPRR